MRAEWEKRNVWDNLRGRDKRDVGEVGNRGGGRIAEEVLNGERDEGSERRGPGQGPGLGAGERETSPPVGARVRRT